MLCYQGLWGQEPELIEAEEKQSTWNYYLQNPIDINHVKESELENLQILSPKQIKAFLEHRRHIGVFESIYELQTITHWDMAILRQIQVFLVCQQPSKKWYHTDQSRQQVLLRWNKASNKKKDFLLQMLEVNRAMKERLGATSCAIEANSIAIFEEACYFKKIRERFLGPILPVFSSK
jgi:hypothetical protein